MKKKTIQILGKQIFVTKSELKEYLQTSKRTNKIRRFWKEILAKVPKYLDKEIHNRLVQLVEQEEGEFQILGAKAFQFEPEHCSDELFNYLNTFAVFVEDETFEINRWKKKMKEYKDSWK